MSFGGDGTIVSASVFGEENHARGILTFSTPHLIAITGMITSLHLYKVSSMAGLLESV